MKQEWEGITQKERRDLTLAAPPCSEHNHTIFVEGFSEENSIDMRDP